MSTKTKSPAGREHLQERTSGLQIDREAGVIRNVRIIGVRSKNGRRYLPEALKEAIPLYEGAKVYIDHTDPDASKGRKIKERWGKLSGVYQGEDGALYGDLHYLKGHEETELILEAAERFDDFGLSHDVEGLMRKVEGGEPAVYKIGRVFSVDVVTDPATNNNFFESELPTMKKKLLETLREHESKNETAKYLLGRLAEMDPLYTDEMPLDAELSDEASPEDEIAAAFETAILAILAMDGSVDEKIEKIRMLLEVEAEVSGQGGSSAPSEADPAVTEAIKTLKADVARLDAENKSLREEKARAEAEAAAVKAREAVEKELRDAGREVTPIRVKTLLALSEATDRKAAIEDWPALTEGRKPASSPSKFREETDRKPADDYNSFRKVLDLKPQPASK